MKPRVFRSRGAWILGWVWLVFAALNAVDLIARGSLPSSLIAGSVLGVLTAVIYVTCLRPGIVLRQDGVLVRNPLRDAFIPWGALGDVRVTHAIHLESGERTVRSWTPQVSTRELTRSARAGSRDVSGGRNAAHAEALAGRTHAHWIAEQITEEAARGRSRGGDTAGAFSLTWSPVSLAVVAAALVLVVVGLVAAL
ncbi:PH domain-containing protein [Thermopolyspora sp. NPDC052614]|uniref:PH domain-containing protein n=1 Tax=Thermopolyspora sp. NPDC052614 TaxID=3155682 RepID=UPI00343CFBDB